MVPSSTLPDTIDGKAVQSLVEAHAIRGATVLGQPGGWAVLVRYGALERAVAAQRARKPRLWRNLATAATFVRDELGVARFEVDALRSRAGRGSASPSRSGRAHEAKARSRRARRLVPGGSRKITDARRQRRGAMVFARRASWRSSTPASPA